MESSVNRDPGDQGVEKVLRIVIHDYSGHPFQLQLSRELARRGHRLVHQYSADYVTGKGSLAGRTDDPSTFEVEPLTLGRQFSKYAALRRGSQEIRYGRLLARQVLRRKPDVAVMCNVPLLAHSVANRRLRRAGVPYVFWHQDVYSHAIATAARMRLGRAGALVGWSADSLEARIARGSAAVVPISDAFVPVLTAWGVPPERIAVIPNWGALDELPPRPRVNSWASQNGLVGRPVVLYSGTLGLKHDPEILVGLAQGMQSTQPDARMVVISEGRGREHLERRKREAGLESLILLDFQPYESLPDVMGAADVLVAVLEQDASRYSVPSKILSYLCAGRPVLGIMPLDNGASVTLRESGAGVVVAPGEPEAAVEVLRGLLADPAAREGMGFAGRRYAETHFDIPAIASKFEEILLATVGGGGTLGARPPATSG